MKTVLLVIAAICAAVAILILVAPIHGIGNALAWIAGCLLAQILAGFAPEP